MRIYSLSGIRHPIRHPNRHPFRHPCTIRLGRWHWQHQFHFVNIQFIQQLWLAPIGFFPCCNDLGESRSDILTKANHSEHILYLRITGLRITAPIDGLYG